MTDYNDSLIGESTHLYVHRHEEHGRQAPLQPGKYMMICDVYECERKPRVGESGTSYRDYALQCGKLIETTKETHHVK